MNWKALYVSSRAEKKIQLRLTELGIEAYVPLKKERKQWSDRKKTVYTPLLNGYVFVHLNEKQRELVFKSSGVIQYVRYNGKDAIIRDIEIQILKDIEQKGYYAEAGPLADFKIGDRTLITHGQFKGMRGIIERNSGKEIYTIALESIGFSLRVNLPAEILSKTKA
ncbi:MAG: UpxY family transcription antiterminator [Sphingobacteriaceae bacterium]|nr:UpxY family transcription antiterminator [Sphingobacteriaceae bacterium]